MKRFAPTSVGLCLAFDVYRRQTRQLDLVQRVRKGLFVYPFTQPHTGCCRVHDQLFARFLMRYYRRYDYIAWPI